MDCFINFIVQRKTEYSGFNSRHCLHAVLVLLFAMLPLPDAEVLGAVEFENFDESDVTGESLGQDGDELNAMPEIEAEQHDLRLERRNASGLSLGEVMPLVSLAVEYQRHLNESTSLFLTVGAGSITTTSQDSGESTISNKLNTRALELGHMWWTSKNFPIASSAFLTVVSGDGVAIGTSTPKGHYRVSALGAGGDLKMETLFENGFWLKWSLISLRYLQPVMESHTSISSKNLSSIRSRFLGLKFIGITNITVGYAW